MRQAPPMLESRSFTRLLDCDMLKTVTDVEWVRLKALPSELGAFEALVYKHGNKGVCSGRAEWPGTANTSSGVTTMSRQVCRHLIVALTCVSLPPGAWDPKSPRCKVAHRPSVGTHGVSGPLHYLHPRQIFGNYLCS